MWRPQASLAHLQMRAALSRQVREFFYKRDVWEVDVPVLGAHSVTDPYIDALSVDMADTKYWLQTSPEYFMKRLLAAGSGSIFYFGKAFRYDEQGRLHHPEFTMLEWYRCGMTEHELMDEVTALALALSPKLRVSKLSYAEVFLGVFGVNPHRCALTTIVELARVHCSVNWDDEPRSTWLDLLFSHCIEPSLPSGLVHIYDYPACQSALARLTTDIEGDCVAQRFESFINGVELANGYNELTCADEQVRRFEADNALREKLGKPRVVLDQPFIDAIKEGLPTCSGVALGFDRLVMAILALDAISEQRSF